MRSSFGRLWRNHVTGRRSLKLVPHRLLVFTLTAGALLLANSTIWSVETIAHYADGTVDRDLLTSWRLFQGTSDPERDPELHELESIVIQLHLEQIARSRGLDRQIETQTALWWQEISLLETELRRHWAANIEVSPMEISEAAKKLERTVPKRVRLRSLLVAAGAEVSGSTRNEKRALTEDYRKQVRNGADFARLARHHSDSQSRWRDGLIGWVKPGKLAPRLEKIAMRMEPGEVSQVIETAEGFVLLYCEDVKAATTINARQAGEKAKRSVRRQKLLDIQAAFQRNAVASMNVHPQMKKLLGADSDSESDLQVVTSDSLALTIAQVRALVAQSGAASALPALLEESVYRQSAAAQARALGLDKNERVASRSRWARTTLLASRALRGLVIDGFREPTAAEIESRYSATPGAFQTPELYLVSAIQQYATPSTIRDKFRVMTQASDALAAGLVDFETMAKELSELPSGKQGGKLGWRTRSQLAGLGPIVNKALHTLEDGQTSELVQQAEGLHGDSSLWIVRREETRGPRTMTLSEAYDTIKSLIANERIQALQAKIHRDILGEQKVRLTKDPAGTAEP